VFAGSPHSLSLILYTFFVGSKLADLKASLKGCIVRAREEKLLNCTNSFLKMDLSIPIRRPE
jgi:hypothetical protein